MISSGTPKRAQPQVAVFACVVIETSLSIDRAETSRKVGPLTPRGTVR